MQDCYVAVFTHAKDYTPRGKPLAWILTITKNLAYKRMRSASRISYEEEDFERYIDSRESMVNRNEQRVILKEMLELLSDEERQIVTLHAVSGMKHKHIAQLLELPLATVLSKYNRALKKIRASMQEEKTT